MSKTSQSIKMLKILASRDKVSILELASLLETNPRNIPEYRTVLEEAGYIINSTRGPSGGYSLDKESMLPVPKLTENQKNALYKGLAYLKARNDFAEIKQFDLAMQNVLSSTILSEEIKEMAVLNRYPLSMSIEEIEIRYSTLERAIEQHKKVEIEYISLKNQIKKRIIHPYKLFMYNNAWYVIANDENDKQVKYFKINRIKSFSILDNQFRIVLDYNENNFLNDFGMKQDGKWYGVKLKLFNQYSMLATERIYGKNQSVEFVDDKTAILTCEMQNEEYIKNFVLSLGENCEVLEPKWLIKNVAKECETIIKKYK